MKVIKQNFLNDELYLLNVAAQEKIKQQKSENENFIFSSNQKGEGDLSSF